MYDVLSSEYIEADVPEFLLPPRDLQEFRPLERVRGCVDDREALDEYAPDLRQLDRLEFGDSGEPLRAERIGSQGQGKWPGERCERTVELSSDGIGDLGPCERLEVMSGLCQRDRSVRAGTHAV